MPYAAGKSQIIWLFAVELHGMQNENGIWEINFYADPSE
jgi:hypothetical protein